MVFSHFIQNLLQANSGEPDQTPRSAASNLVLHCLSMSLKKDAWLKWAKQEIPLNKVLIYEVMPFSRAC